MSTVKFEMCCFRGKRSCSLQQVGQVLDLLSTSEVRHGVYMRGLFSTVSSVWLHWFSPADCFFPSLIFAAPWIFLISSLQVISIHLNSFPHQCGISPLAQESTTNYACPSVIRCDTTMENCKRSRGCGPVQKRRGSDAFWKSGEFEPEPGMRAQGCGGCWLSEKQVTKGTCLWQCFEHNWKICH